MVGQEFPRGCTLAEVTHAVFLWPHITTPSQPLSSVGAAVCLSWEADTGSKLGMWKVYYRVTAEEGKGRKQDWIGEPLDPSADLAVCTNQDCPSEESYIGWKCLDPSLFHCLKSGWALSQEECEFGWRVKVDLEELKQEAASRTRDIICRA